MLNPGQEYKCVLKGKQNGDKCPSDNKTRGAEGTHDTIIPTLLNKSLLINYTDEIPMRSFYMTALYILYSTEVGYCVLSP